MNRYKVTLLVPHETTIEAEDLGLAHKEAMRLTHTNNTAEGTPQAVLHSVIEIKEPEAIDFEPLPPAA